MCAGCHAPEYENWQESHRDLAMRPVKAATVPGDFNDSKFRNYGITSTFFRDGDRFQVRIDGVDGALQVNPNATEAHHALGLSLVRLQRQPEQAILNLQAAVARAAILTQNSAIVASLTGGGDEQTQGKRYRFQ